MRDHPALAHKYLLPQFTRGRGIELGAGIDDSTPPLYAHFGKLRAEVWNEPLDFVLVCNAQGHDWFEPTDYTGLVKKGGYLLHANGDTLAISQRISSEDWSIRNLLELPLQGPAACVVRYGGFGDMLQAANVFPALKRAGFNVFVMTTPQGQAIIAEDPNVDGFILQDTDQVPNDELSAFWEVQARRFDRFVNLSESVEGTLLAYPGRANHGWPDIVRRTRLGSVNYLEWTAELAQVPYASESRFYPTEDERDAVQRFMARVRLTAVGGEGRPGPVNAPARFTIVWALSGSSIHKAYPHQDLVIERVLQTMPEASLVLVGDTACQILEAGWEDNPRVHCLSGRIGIRETLALAQVADCVVGPETGILNAVAFEPMGKVILLSHSSRQNLTAHWFNTYAMEPPTPCYPCHRLHHDRRYCPEHEPTGAAMCAWEIDPMQVHSAIAYIYDDWRFAPAMRELRAA